ncbi:hypothetical protein CCACVL1_12343 [Corchorus capsularis]|uniref:Uncharacterized protein n=1 Tax=Corchorus capsularis TaxID=210143 RepID=A0A1R3IGJ0_COCAP|nr:hypothetical protein CCACVL1_12343 [Corchorus capsularis]
MTTIATSDLQATMCDDSEIDPSSNTRFDIGLNKIK